MKINLKKTVNRFFSNPSFEMIYSEAMANALDANATVMSIDISIKSFEQPESMTIKIQDNGDGFSEENFLRYSSLMNTKDSSHKGLDRLVIGFAALESRVARLRKLHKCTHIRFEFRKGHALVSLGHHAFTPVFKKHPVKIGRSRFHKERSVPVKNCNAAFRRNKIRRIRICRGMDKRFERILRRGVSVPKRKRFKRPFRKRRLLP